MQPALAAVKPRCRRVLAIAGLALGVALLASTPALAHEGGKAEPRIKAAISQEPGLSRVLTVRLVDADSGDPIQDAVVSATLESPGHRSSGPVRLRAIGGAAYRVSLEFPETGAWTVRISVRGEDVLKASAKLAVTVEDLPATETGASGTSEDEHDAAAGHEEGLATHLEEDNLTSRDYVSMAFLWTHTLAAMTWILGVLAMAIGLSTRPGILAEDARARLGAWYVAWGAWVHWALVPVIVGTGIYNMLKVTPFALAYTPSDLDRVREVPFGLMYESVLIVKLGLFAVLLLTGTMTLLRAIHLRLPVVQVSNPHPGFFRVLASALGPAGIVYLLSVPLILGAAMALRYIHVLNHAAVILSSTH